MATKMPTNIINAGWLDVSAKATVGDINRMAALKVLNKKWRNRSIAAIEAVGLTMLMLSLGYLSVGVAGNSPDLATCTSTRRYRFYKHCWATWYNFGCELKTVSDVIVVCGQPYTKIECFVKSLHCDPSRAKTWFNLAHTMMQLPAPPRPVTVFDVPRTMADCLTEALRCDPDCSSAWNHLGSLVHGEERVHVSGKELSQAQCFMEAIRSNARNTAAWKNLSYVLNDDERVTISGKQFSRADCVANGAH